MLENGSEARGEMTPDDALQRKRKKIAVMEEIMASS